MQPPGIPQVGVARLTPRMLNRSQRVSTALAFLQYCQAIESGGGMPGMDRGRDLEADEKQTRHAALALLEQFIGGEIGDPDLEPGGGEAGEPVDAG
ncbi:MAG: hypothetical protein E6Q97_11095 [Desulfurellales bacterium]|nr:MAG: hypothetical protein E6Q97_11095 [Desulfurellales bacterium]